MMTKFKILNFQDLFIKNTLAYNKPFEETGLTYEDETTVVIIRDPYEYFDYILEHYIRTEMSPTLAKDTRYTMDTLDNEAFLKWLDTLNYLPIVNPQTFQMDMRKNIENAMGNLALFDYVVPYEKLDDFLTHIAPDVKIKKNETHSLPFSLSALKENELTQIFIGKDLKLYEYARKLWKLSEDNQFKSLKILIDKKAPAKKDKKRVSKKKLYDGIVGTISETSVKGWVYHTEHSESIMVGIYKNGTLLEKIKADKMRPDIKKRKGHPTGMCGFNITFKDPVFGHGDQVEVKTLPDETSIPFGKQAKAFLEIA